MLPFNGFGLTLVTGGFEGAFGVTLVSIITSYEFDTFNIPQGVSVIKLINLWQVAGFD